MTSLLTGNVQIPETKLQSLLLFFRPGAPRRACSQARIDPTERAKVFIWRKVERKVNSPRLARVGE